MADGWFRTWQSTGQLLRSERQPGELSGGQRAQLALTLAVAKRPRLLILDEPVASLDPLARREFLAGLMEIVADQGVSVVLSSHLVADLERVCDYLIVLVNSRVRVTGDVEHLLATHHLLTGPRYDTTRLPGGMRLIQASHTDRQSSLLVRTEQPILDPADRRSGPVGTSYVESVGDVDLLVIAQLRTGESLRSIVVLEKKWPALVRHEQAAAWLQVWIDLGRAPRTIDAYARGLAEYLGMCDRNGVDPLTANRRYVAKFVRELSERPSRRGANVVSINSGVGLANATLQQRLVPVRLYYDFLVEEGCACPTRSAAGAIRVAGAVARSAALFLG